MEHAVVSSTFLPASLRRVMSRAGSMPLACDGCCALHAVSPALLDSRTAPMGWLLQAWRLSERTPSAVHTAKIRQIPVDDMGSSMLYAAESALA